MKSQKARSVRPARKLLSCALASCLMLGVAPTVLAQSTGATLRGSATVDATIKVTNVDTGLTRSVRASGGSYSLVGLPPGTYRIDVDAGGQTSSQALTLQVGQTATLNLDVAAPTAPGGDATTLETVTVTAPILIETKTSEIATYVSNKQIESLPQGTRNFLAFADTVPGMVFTQDGNGNTKLRSGGQSANNINVFIDGVGQKSYTLPGGVAGQDTSRGNPFPQSAIGEYKVITQNYKAEFDQISSAAIVAATRSGTNEFEGDFFYDRTVSDWRKATPAEERAGRKVDSKEEQYGVSLGGPIIQDALHFFVAYEAKEYVTPRTLGLGSPGRYDVNEVPLDLLAQLGPSSSPFKQEMYFGKLSWSIDERNYLEFSAQVRQEDEIIRSDGAFTADRATVNSNDVDRYDLRYQYSGDNWLNDAHLTFEDTSWAPSPLNSGNGYVLTVSDLTTPGQRNNTGTILNAGAGTNNQNKGQEGYSLQDDLTFTGWDRHTVKMGVKYKSVEVNAVERNFSNPQFFYDINMSASQPYRVEFGQAIPGTSGGFTSSRNKQFGVYIQDDWEVNDHLTLNYGVRWDYETTPAYEDHVTPAALAQNLRDYPNFDNADFDVEDYISDGGNRDAFKGAWQPRVGFSYDINADQRFVLFGGAGRSYDRNLFDYIQNEKKTTSYAAPYRAYFVDADGVCRNAGGCVPWDPAYLQPGGTDALTGDAFREWYLNNNDLKVPYSDQFSLGVRNIFGMFGADWNSEVALSYVRSYDGISIRLGNRRPDGSFFAPGASWGTPWGFDPPFGRIVLVDNMIDTRTKSILAKLEKPYTTQSGWGMTLAYTYTDAETNSAADGFPEIFAYPDTSWFGWLPVKGVAEHRLVGTGIWDGPWGFVFSTKLTLESQKNRVGTNCLSTELLGDGDCFFDYYKPEGSIGLLQWDLAATKVWAMSDTMKFRVRADVLNVTNRRNWNAYDDWWGFDGSVNANRGRHDDQITLPTRMFKLSFGLTW